MKRTAPDRTVFQPKPVDRVEVHDRHAGVRLLLAALAVVIAVAAFACAIGALTHIDQGWREIEVSSSGEMNCSQDFIFSYDLGGSGISAAAELKMITALYTEATERAYRVFSAYEACEESNNLYALNRGVNTPIQVDPMLYQAFELVEQLGSRYVYLAPVYAEYHSLFFCSEDWETVGFDPYQNEDVRLFVEQAAAFARSPADVRVELLGNSTLQLTASDAYLAFAAEYGIESLVDFSWMKNAFIIDTLAQVMEDAGYNRGVISSYDGFVRSLSAPQLSYAYNLYDRPQDQQACKAACLSCPGGTSLVNLRSFPLNRQKEIYYYGFADGTVRTAHADLKDGMSRSAIPSLLATSHSAGCAETLLRLLPFYAAETLDEEGLMALVEQGIFPLYPLNGRIVATDSSVTLDGVAEGYQVIRP
ncbi:MAG: hypothetical protein ACI4MM_12205 [Candidatus Ventricola sp.]